MKKEKNTAKHKTIDQFEFHILPLSITFSKKQSATFYIYVQKGAQVLGKIDQPIHAKQTQYYFDKLHTKRFRIANDKNLTYQWSLYKSTSKDQEEYLQSISFNIKNRLQQYMVEFEKIETDLYRIYQEKEKKTQLQQIWKDLRYDLTKAEHQMSCNFPKTNAKINFKLLIKCEYDFIYEKWEENKQKIKLQKNLKAIRRGSIQSRNSRNKLSSQSSVAQIKDRSQQSFDHLSSNKTQSLSKETEQKKSSQTEEQQNMLQSEIKITNPEGMDVTGQAEIPEKFLNHKKTMDLDIYCMKKSSMLSDIIEQSYQGSSNVNFSKSNQGQKLKSVDIIREQEEPIFSPMIKTQTFESQRHEQYFNDIKRTATLAHKHSQEFQLQQTPKPSSKKVSLYSNNNDKGKIQNQIQDVRDDKFVRNNTMKSSSRRSSEMEEQNKEVIEDFSEAKKQIIKNVIKVFIIVAVLVFALNFLNLFGDNAKEIYSKQKNHKTQKDTVNRLQKLQKPTKTKSNKVKS